MEDNRELYMYLGNQLNTFFFMHTITNKLDYNINISGQLYGMLIQEKMIVDCEENVIIYDFNPFEREYLEIIIIQHGNKKKYLQFDTDSISTFLNVLLHAPRDELYVITYDYKKKVYLSYLIEQKKVTDKIPPGDIQISNIHNLLCIKPIC